MKGYKTAYTPHEVKKREEAAERRGIKMAVETIVPYYIGKLDGQIDILKHALTERELMTEEV